MKRIAITFLVVSTITCIGFGFVYYFREPILKGMGLWPEWHEEAARIYAATQVSLAPEAPTAIPAPTSPPAQPEFPSAPEGAVIGDKGPLSSEDAAATAAVAVPLGEKVGEEDEDAVFVFVFIIVVVAVAFLIASFGGKVRKAMR